ncbi:MFS general substrate transporter [Vararia minispora EC-137]|uniref:MFS general substrate transporter n=1 Tax=Vararia minispora EC-137 TaxID=1314806 RepID=A0ACB8QK80_9AGAM|nr:MFS general substrate transporter [Vararia minispora EC-137]
MDPDHEKGSVEHAESRTNAEGTYHQSQVQPQSWIKSFTSQPSKDHAAAVQADAEQVVYDAAEEKKVRRKIDFVVLPLVVSAYIFNQFDRTNIGNAHVITKFNENYGLTSNNQWTLALSIFYVGYCLLEMPANVLQRYIGANRFFFLALSFWSIASLSFVYARGYGGLLALRILLGVGEAGFYAGMIYYLSFWYTKRELATRISLCMTGTLPGAIGGLLAFGLVRAHTSALQGWQFLFLIEAIPTVVMAFVLLFFLPPFPFAASFLQPRQRAIAQARLNREHRPTSHGGMTGWQGFKAIVSDINAWLFVLVYTSFNIGVATITYFLPTLIREFGFSPINSQGLTVAPYVAFHSDRTRDRGWHIMASASVAFVGYLILAICAQASTGASYFALFLVVAGLFSLFPLVMSWAAAVFSPTSKRGVGTAFIVSISNCVSIASPQIYFDPKDNYRKGHAIACGMLFLCILATFTLRTRLSLKNKHREELVTTLTQEGKLAPSSKDEELPDTDPRYRFMT